MSTILLVIAGFAWLSSVGNVVWARKYEDAARQYAREGEVSWDRAEACREDAIRTLGKTTDMLREASERTP